MNPMMFVLLLLPLAACSPEVGSKAWCADMKAKPKGEWTMNDPAITPNTVYSTRYSRHEQLPLQADIIARAIADSGIKQ